MAWSTNREVTVCVSGDGLTWESFEDPGFPCWTERRPPIVPGWAVMGQCDQLSEVTMALWQSQAGGSVIQSSLTKIKQVCSSGISTSMENEVADRHLVSESVCTCTWPGVCSVSVDRPGTRTGGRLTQPWRAPHSSRDFCVPGICEI